MGGGGQRLNELKLFVERIAQKNGEKQWSFGYGTCHFFFFFFFFEKLAIFRFVMHLGILRRKRGK